MIDPVKTENLREKIKKISEEASDDRVKRAEKTITNFFYLIARIAALHFSQLIIFNQFSMPSFRWWETIILYFGLSAITSLFRKQQ